MSKKGEMLQNLPYINYIISPKSTGNFEVFDAIIDVTQSNVGLRSISALPT